MMFDSLRLVICEQPLRKILKEVYGLTIGLPEKVFNIHNGIDACT